MTGGYGDAGAVVCYEGQTPQFDNCIFRNNTSVYMGGAVASIGSITRFTNCEFSYNQAYSGGAVASLGSSSIEFENCVFLENTAEQGGAINFQNAGPTTLTGCTFARNHSPEGAHIAVTFGLLDTLVVDHSILAFGTDSEAIFTDNSVILALSCVDIFGNTGGDWVGAISGQESTMGNMSVDPQFCGLANPLMPLMLTTDSPCAPENNPECGLIGAFPVGCGGVAGAGGSPSAAADIRLLPCYPNPFNPTTTISFELDFAADISLAVYGAGGELVRTLEGGFYPAGTNSTLWQGKNNHGQAVASGVYFARLTVGSMSVVQKMILLR